MLVAIGCSKNSSDPPRTISIQVLRPVGGAITIDGKHVGKAPLILHRPTSTTPMVVESPGRTSQQIVPDHDQVVILRQPSPGSSGSGRTTDPD